MVLKEGYVHLTLQDPNVSFHIRQYFRSWREAIHDHINVVDRILLEKKTVSNSSSKERREARTPAHKVLALSCEERRKIMRTFSRRETNYDDRDNRFDSETYDKILTRAKQ